MQIYYKKDYEKLYCCKNFVDGFKILFWTSVAPLLSIYMQQEPAQTRMVKSTQTVNIPQTESRKLLVPKSYLADKFYIFTLKPQIVEIMLHVSITCDI